MDLPARVWAGLPSLACTTLGGCPYTFTFTAPAPAWVSSADLRDASWALPFPREPSPPAPWPPPGPGPRPGSSLGMVTSLTAQWAKTPTEEAGARGESRERPGEGAGRAGETPGRPLHGDPPRAGSRSLTAAGLGRWTLSSRLPCVPGLVPPLWSQRLHTRGLYYLRVSSGCTSRGTAWPVRSWRLSYAEVRCWPGLGSPLRAQEPVGRIQVWRAGVL